MTEAFKSSVEAGSVEARSVAGGHGISWWTQAWPLFMGNAGLWIVMALILIVVSIVLSVIPLLGSLALGLLAPVVAGSWMMAVRKVVQGGALEVGDLLLGFKDKLTPLLVLGAVLLAATFLVATVAGVLGLGAVMGLVAGGVQHSAGGMLAAMGTGMLAMLVFMALGMLASMALWFAPALVVFRDVPPIDALKASFAASLKNIVPFLLYGVVYLVLAIVASIPFGLGWVVLVPVLLISVYVSYEDVFGA